MANLFYFRLFSSALLVLYFMVKAEVAWGQGSGTEGRKEMVPGVFIFGLSHLQWQQQQPPLHLPRPTIPPMEWISMADQLVGLAVVTPWLMR